MVVVRREVWHVLWEGFNQVVQETGITSANKKKGKVFPLQAQCGPEGG